MIVQTTNMDIESLDIETLIKNTEKISKIADGEYTRADLMEAESLVEGVFTDVEGFEMNQVSILPSKFLIREVRAGISELKRKTRDRLERDKNALLETYSGAVNNIARLNELMTSIASAKIHEDLNVSVLKFKGAHIGNVVDLSIKEQTRDWWSSHDYEIRAIKGVNEKLVFDINQSVRELVEHAQLDIGDDVYDFYILREYISKNNVTYEDVLELFRDPTDVIDSLNEMVERLSISIGRCTSYDFSSTTMMPYIQNKKERQDIEGFAKDKLSLLFLHICSMLRYDIIA